MKKLIKKLILSFFTLTFLSLSAQQKDFNQLQNTYKNYFELPRESIYLHLNKEIFLNGEEIWFKGYAYDRKSGVPFNNTSNVYLSLHDSTGLKEKQWLFYADGGYFKGNIKIDSTYSDGIYYLKASTNWMRNFKEDDSHVRQIKILSENIHFDEERISENYNIQFLPEGGNLVEDIPNIVGVKATDENGLGVRIENIEVRNQYGKLVTRFSTNKFGLGKFEYTPKKGNFYRAKIVLYSGKEIVSRLPLAKSYGVNLHVKNSPYHEVVLVTLQTNEETLDMLEENFKLVFHRNGLLTSYPVKFEGDDAKFNVKLQKDELEFGVNAVTVMDGNNVPFEQRQFFNWSGWDFKKVDVKVENIKGDSLEIAIKSPLSEQVGLSVSVLPAGTLSYSGSRSIMSNFYLRPYVKGFIERPSYYFTDVDAEKKYGLDLLLLTQGWSKYDWGDIFENPPQKMFDFEDGLVVWGTLNSAADDMKDKEILLHKSANHDSQILQFEEGGNKFAIKNFFPQRDENLYFSFMNEKGKLSPPGMFVRLDGVYKAGPLENIDLYRTPNLSATKNRMATISDTEELILEPKTIELEGVTVTEDKYLEEAKSNPRVPAFLKNKITPVDVELARQYPTVIDLLRSRGYEVREELQAFDGGNANIDPISRVSIRSRRTGGILLILDDVRQPNLDVLYRFPMTQVESFYIDRLSRYQGATMDGLVETIYIYTRRGKELNTSPGSEYFVSKNSFEYKVKDGFEPPKEFYNPKYATYLNEAFQNFGTVHWEPDVYIEPNGKNIFKVLDTGNTELLLFIEGMGSDGSLISQVEKISIGREQ